MLPLTRCTAAALAALAAYFTPVRSSLAAPQWNSALIAGIAGQSEGSDLWDRTQFFGGVRGDVLFLRDDSRSFGAGPSLELATAGFSDVRTVAGLSTLLPLGDLWGIGFRPAGYARFTSDGTFPGLSARGWFGIQTYNHYGAYAPRGGVVVGYDHDLGASNVHVFVVSAEVDGLVIALPVILLYEWLRGSPDDD